MNKLKHIPLFQGSIARLSQFLPRTAHSFQSTHTHTEYVKWLDNVNKKREIRKLQNKLCFWMQ